MIKNLVQINKALPLPNPCGKQAELINLAPSGLGVRQGYQLKVDNRRGKQASLIDRSG